MSFLEGADRWVRALSVLTTVLLLVGCTVAALPAGAATTTNETGATFRRLIGTRGADAPAPGDVKEPQDLAVAPNGDVYVTDTPTNRVVQYDNTGAFVRAWGGGPAGTGPGQFDQPRGIAIGTGGAVYVVDGGNDRVQRFSPTGQFLSAWGTTGEGDGQFDEPWAIAVAPDGDVWVTDLNCHIQRFSSTGAFEVGWGDCWDYANEIYGAFGIAVAADGTLYVSSGSDAGGALGRDQVFHVAPDGTRLGSLGGTGSGDGQLRFPAGLDLAPDGTLYVVDGGNSRVQRFAADGSYMSQWNGTAIGSGRTFSFGGVAIAPDGGVYTTARPGSGADDPRVQRFTATGTFVSFVGGFGDGLARFSGPKDVAAGPGGGLVVLDAGNQRVVRSDSDLVFDTAWGHLGSAPGELMNPEAIAVSDGGTIYVADTGNNRVQRFAANGTFLSQWGEPGAGPGQFNAPAGIDVDDTGDVWVAERGNHRVQRFSATGTFEGAFGSAGSGPSQFSAPSAVAVSQQGVFVADTGNKRVQRLDLDGTPAGRWSTGDLVPKGAAADPRTGVWVSGSHPTTGHSAWRYSADGVLLSSSHIWRSEAIEVTVDGRMYVPVDPENALAEYVLAAGPLLHVSMTTPTPQVEVGQRIDYDVLLRNTGAVALTGLAASYTGTPECDGPLPDVPIGEVRTVRCSHTAAAGDLGTLSNQIAVTAGGIGEPVTSVAGATNVAVTHASPRLLGQFGASGTGPGQLQGATDLDLGPDGEVYVHNLGAGSVGEVDVFSAGAFERTIPVAATAERMAVGGAGDVYLMRNVITSYSVPGGSAPGYESRVTRFSPTGQSAGLVSGSQRPSQGKDIAADVGGTHVFLTVRRQTLTWWDDWYGWQYQDMGEDQFVDMVPGTGSSSVGSRSADAVDSAGTKIVRLSFGSSLGGHAVVTDGSTLQEFSVSGSSPARDVATDASGNVYVAYHAANEVRVFSSAGTLLARWPVTGDRLVVSPEGLVYVLDRAAGVVRVYGFGISGVVADEVTDAPLGGVVAIAVDSVGQLAAAAVSDGAGRYRLRVGPGQYRVGFVDPSGGHLGEWAWGHAITDPGSAVSVSVGVTGATVNIGLLAARGSVAGTVSADGGGVVPGAWVAAISQSTGIMRGTTAAGDGTYSLAGVDAGGHVVVFVDPSGQRRFEFFNDRAFASLADPVNVVAGAVSAANAGLPVQGPFASGSTISGTVVDDDAGGAAVAGAWVVAVRTDGVMRAGAVTNGSGQYSLAVGPGSYKVQVLDPAGLHTGQWVADRGLDDFDGAQVVTVAAAETATVDVGLESNRGRIGGTVTDPSGPAAGTVVLAISMVNGQLAGAATAAGNGSYTVGGLRPGSYLVAFVDPWGEHGFEYHDDVTNPTAATPVTVTATQITTVDADLG